MADDIEKLLGLLGDPVAPAWCVDKQVEIAESRSLCRAANEGYRFISAGQLIGDTESAQRLRQEAEEDPRRAAAVHQQRMQRQETLRAIGDWLQRVAPEHLDKLPPLDSQTLETIDSAVFAQKLLPVLGPLRATATGEEQSAALSSLQYPATSAARRSRRKPWQDLYDIHDELKANNSTVTDDEIFQEFRRRFKDAYIKAKRVWKDPTVNTLPNYRHSLNRLARARARVHSQLAVATEQGTD